MVKLSLWMHKEELKKIVELYGDSSINLFIMKAVRKQIEEEEERKQNPLLQDTSQVVGGQHMPHTVETGAGRTPSKVRKERSMLEIRRLAAKGYSHKEIMEKLKLPRTTYFRYLSDAFENDWQLLKLGNNDAAMLALEISKLKETFREAEKMLYEIVSSPKTPTRRKITACDAMCRTAAAALQLTYQGPLIMNRATKDIDLAWHFRGRFASGEVGFA
jgi:hypothetical protein